MSHEAIVIGAGIIGGTIAWRLAQSGFHVTLFDAGGFGEEASSRAAGMLAPGGEYAERSASAELALESLRTYPGFVEELSEETGVAIDYRQCGAVELAETGEDWTALVRRARNQAGVGITSTELDEPQLRELLPSLAPRAGWRALHFPADALVCPKDIVRALRAASSVRGVALREHTPIRRVEPGPSEVTVQFDSGRISAEVAILAAGAWTSQVEIAGSEAVPTAFPVKGHLVGFDLDAGSLGPIVRTRQTYLLERGSGRTIAGSSTEHAGWDRGVDSRIVADIVSRARAILPGLLAREPAEAWSGFRPGIEAEGPRIGRYHDSALWLAYGHYRNGILLAPVTADRIVNGIISSSEKD